MNGVSGAKSIGGAIAPLYATVATRLLLDKSGTL
jgi:hypothetical protein